MSYRVLFFGTPAIAANCLQALLDSNINVVGVVTKPDKAVGRKQIITPSEVKKLALERNILVLQPNKVSEATSEIVNLKPDLIVTCAYGQLIPENILIIPQFHCVNVHTSLLPRWRGGAPIHYAIWKNDPVTGVTLMYMVKALDAGDILFQESVPIDSNETYQTLYGKLSDLAYSMLTKHINALFSSKLNSLKQDETRVTIAKNISRDDELIDFADTAANIDRKIRAFNNAPIAYCKYNNDDVKVYECINTNEFVTKGAPGTIETIDRNGIKIAAKDNYIIFTKIQLPGKTPILIKDLINGNHPFIVGRKFN